MGLSNKKDNVDLTNVKQIFTVVGRLELRVIDFRYIYVEPNDVSVCKTNSRKV